MSDKFKVSFVDKSVHVTHVGNRTKASILSGFKFNTFERGFNRYFFDELPSVVVDILNEYGYQRDYKLGMWVLKTTGVSSCNQGDEYDVLKGRRIALSRAKKKAYETAQKVTETISTLFLGIVNLCDCTSITLQEYIDVEDAAIENVIDYGVSKPTEQIKKG